MKVKDLIEELSKFDGEDEVIILTQRKNKVKPINYIKNCTKSGTRTVLISVGRVF